MFKYKGNESVKFIINEMVNEDYLEFRECNARLALYPDNYFNGNEPELILKNYLKGNEMAIRELLSKAKYLDANDIDKIVDYLSIIDEEEVVMFFYAKESLSESQKLLLLLYEKYMSSTPETKVQLEKIQKNACEVIVNGFKHSVNDHAMKTMRETILDIIEENVSKNNTYHNCHKYADLIS